MPVDHTEKQTRPCDLDTETALWQPSRIRVTLMYSNCADRNESQDAAEPLHKNMTVNGRVGLFNYTATSKMAEAF